MNITQNKQKAKEPLFAFLHTLDESVLSLLKYKRCSEDGILVTRENTYQQFLQIRTNDLDSLNESELTEMLDAMTDTARTYVDDLKLKVLTSKTDTTKQQEYWHRNMKKANEKLLMNFQDKASQSNKQVSLENIQRLKTVEQTRPDLNFYFVIFAKDENELTRKRRLLMRTANSYRLAPLNKKQTEQVLYRCNNMNDE